MSTRQRATICESCGVRLIAEHVWQSWSKERRKKSRAKRHTGRGLCSTCYGRAQSRGEFKDSQHNVKWADLLADLLDAGLDLNQPLRGQLRTLAPRFGMRPEALTRRWERNKGRGGYEWDYPQPTDADALPPGRWVNDGLIKRFIPDTSPASAAAAFTAADEEAGVPAPEQAERVERALGHVAPRPPAAPSPTRPLIIAGRPCCTDCGCLLSRPTEACPACHAWRQRAAIAATWQPDYYRATETLRLITVTETDETHEAIREVA